MTTATADEQEQAANVHNDHHSANTPSYEDINVPVVLLVGVISIILSFLTIWFVQGVYYHWQSSKIKARSTEVVNMPARVEIDAQKAVLNGGEGITSIDDAIQKVVDEFGKK